MRGLVVGILVYACALAHADPYTLEQTPIGTPSQHTCTSTTSVVVPGGGRHALTVLNQSSTDVFLCFAPTCTTITGTRFQENMGLVEQTYTGIVSCITASGTATLGITVR